MSLRYAMSVPFGQYINADFSTSWSSPKDKPRKPLKNLRPNMSGSMLAATDDDSMDKKQIVVDLERIKNETNALLYGTKSDRKAVEDYIAMLENRLYNLKKATEVKPPSVKRKVDEIMSDDSDDSDIEEVEATPFHLMPKYRN